ncbi:peroxiredoxin family protein [Flagellimonas onchidii]|uniref:peroxiredoxin family protein n=1 Tax=Flagellimonas onchidii TaxID=2562684 RepID=UPI0010A5B5EE|nr:redoxin domain-containing protein [Allomuricauda onchidii]
MIISTNSSFSQEITEENYIKADNEIWNAYEEKMSKLSEFYKSYPKKKDSLTLVAERLEKESNKKNIETAIKYSSTLSGFKRLYMLRLDIPKNRLNSILKKLPKELQESNYGKSIKLHIDSKQIGERDSIYDFKSTDSNGYQFYLSNLKGKNILLLYGGLGCIREEGRNYLKDFYNSVDKNNFKIVVVNSTSNIEELKNLKTKYQLDFIFIDDFKKDHSPIKIIYGAQATPTCFIINKEGTIAKKSFGLPETELNKIKASR